MLGTRIVVPLLVASAFEHRPTGDLYPLIRVNGEDHVMSTPELAAVSLTMLKTALCSASENERSLIQEALDWAFGAY